MCDYLTQNQTEKKDIQISVRFHNVGLLEQSVLYRTRNDFYMGCDDMII